MPTKLHVTGLPNGYSAKALEDIFARYGEIAECDIIKNFAFVHFVNESEAADAIKALDRRSFDDFKLEVRYARDQKVNRDKRPPPSTRKLSTSAASPTKIYVGNLPDKFPQTELRAMFEKFGAITELEIIKNFAFVFIVDEADAQRACSKLHGTKAGDRTLEVKLSHNQRGGGGGSGGNRDSRRSSAPRERERRHDDHRDRRHDDHHNPLASLGLGNPAALLGNLLPMLGGGLNTRSSEPDVRVRREAVHVSRVPGAERFGLSDGFVIHERFYLTPDHPALRLLPIHDLPRITDSAVSS